MPVCGFLVCLTWVSMIVFVAGALSPAVAIHRLDDIKATYYSAESHTPQGSVLMGTCETWSARIRAALIEMKALDVVSMDGYSCY